MKERNELLQTLFNYFVQNGYKMTTHTSLISPSFPDTFNPSGGHDKVTKLITSRDSLFGFHREVFVDVCFRHIDIQKIGLGRHSSLFEMFTFIDASSSENTDQSEVLSITYDLLTNVMGHHPDELFFTTFGGWNLYDYTFSPDKKTTTFLQGLGVNSSNIWPIPGPTNFVYTTNNGDAAGPRVEIFLKNDVHANPLELGTIVFETHFFKKGQLIKSKNRVYGGAFGVERLLMASDGSLISDIAPNKKLTDILRDSIGGRFSSCNHPILLEEIAKAIDYGKALVFISALGEPPSRHGRGQRTKKIIKLLNISAQSLGLTPTKLIDSLIPALYDIYSESYSDIFISVEKCTQNILGTLKATGFNYNE